MVWTVIIVKDRVMGNRRFLPSDIDPKDIKGIEPKHITYVKDQNGKNHDVLFIKENIHLKDGRVVPFLGHYEDYERPYWITQKGRQNHQEKKDYELEANLQRYSSKQIELPNQLARKMNDFTSGPNPPLRRMARSPYLYGVDVSSSCLLKNEMQTKFPGLVTKNRIAASDTETNVFSENEEILCMSVTSQENAILVFWKDWVDEIPDVVEQTRTKAQEFIGEWLDRRNIQLEVQVVATPADVVRVCMERLHEWQPDFMTFWNMDFDVRHMLADLERGGYDPADIFSDPKVPKRYRYYNYKKAQEQKVTASGKTMSINVEDQWSWLTHPASFQIIDSMPVYRQLRVHKGKDSSYALDAILAKEKLGIEKLKFEKASHLTGLRWHQEMQRRYKIEYGVYNLFDSIALEILDEKTNDLSSKISTASKASDYKNFNSGPKRLCDDLHFWYQRQDPKKVIGSSSDDMSEELDRFVIGHEDWIVTLPSYMAAPEGITCIKEMPEYRSLVFTHVADADLVSTYPSVSQQLNISRETRAMEFCKMKGISEHRRREVGVNLTGGRTNSVEICERILGAPSFDQLLAEFTGDAGHLDEKYMKLPPEAVGAIRIDDYEDTVVDEDGDAAA